MVDADAREFVEDLQRASLSEFGYEINEDDCLAWYDADATVDQAIGWVNHGAGPGDMLGSWTHEPDEAFAESEDDD